MIAVFLRAALPWILLGLGVAAAMAYAQPGKDEQED